VQGDAASALGAIKTVAALDGLLEGLSIGHPKVRRAVVHALGEFRNNERAASALIKVLADGDQSYFVEAEAALALGKTRDARGFESLKNALERNSYLDTIRVHAMAGLAELRDERAVEIARGYIAYGQPPRARVAAIGTLARHAALNENRRPQIVDWLSPLADDREFMVRMRVPGAFEEIGDMRGLEAVRRLSERDLDGRIQRRANEAIAAISEGRSSVQQGERLRADIEKMREDNRKLQERLEKLEALSRSKND
jgi:aminopeptidase N